MKGIVRIRWIMLAVWIAAAVGLMFSAPNMQDLVREKGQITVPEGYSSTTANKLLQEANGSGGGSAIFVFHDDDGLDEAEIADVQQAVMKLYQDKDELGVASVMSHFGQEELAEQMVSKDGKTILVALGFDGSIASIGELRQGLYDAIQDTNVDHYLTGSAFIDEDVVISSEQGLQKTELITVAFIMIILFAVFRSFVAPFIPLLTIGISYLCAQSIVAFLVDGLDFPLSNFTQIFMVAVMFGIGTDYCILLISRFKEELGRQGNKMDAILTTYKTAGRTVIFSGLAVLVGFSAIGLSTFILYRSAVAVAVGVLVMLIALFTLMPFFMAVFGKIMFWPTRKALEHKDSGLWKAVGSFSLKRPIISLLIIAAIVVPFLSTYDGDLSYNSLDEIGDQYDSVKAFNLIADSFGSGQVLPTTVVIKAGVPVDTLQGIGVIERISHGIMQVDGVLAVRSASRPTGEEADEGMDLSDQVLQSPQFQIVFDTYMSANRELTTLDVIFSGNPYGIDTLNKVDEVDAAVHNALQGTGMESSEVAIGGVSSIYNDLNHISAQDYAQTALFMLIGIAIILILLLRSLVMPLYLLVSLLLTYYTAMAVSEFIFVNILGYPGLSWAVPFFAFVMLIALGVDYSIFLMDRFNEFKHLDVKTAILESMKKMGTVIISAAVILGGTFAAMLPSGVLSLLQIATAVLAGLFLYAFVFLPLFIPVMVRIFGKGNWWPLRAPSKK